MNGLPSYTTMPLTPIVALKRLAISRITKPDNSNPGKPWSTSRLTSITGRDTTTQ